MSDIAIHVENLTKIYHIGIEQQHHDTMRDALMDSMGRATARILTAMRGNAGAVRSQPHPRRADDRFRALADVSFDVKQGEVLGIIGRNGAGKSTLLKVLSRITEPTSGRAVIRGRVGSLLEVGTGFHPELTGRENVYLNGAILGMRRREIGRKFDEIVAFAGIDRFIDTPVKRYSSGMYVRLAFAVAASLETEILVVDEVLAVGDASFQKKCLGQMNRVAHEGRTVLFVSHNMAAIAQLCSHVIWLDEGRVIEIGPPQEVVAHYLASGYTHVAERVWPSLESAPGDHLARLRAGRVLQNDRVAPVVDINVESEIELEFQVLQPVRNLVTGVSFYDAEGLCIFDSCDWRPNELAPGRYRKRVKVPGPFLAEGQTEVLIELVFWDPLIRSLWLRHALSFDAVDSDHPNTVRGLCKDAWPGTVRPHLQWTDAAACE